MSVDLIGHGGESVRTDAWFILLDLAKEFGWNGKFDSDGVIDVEAQNFGIALYKAIRAIETASNPEQQSKALNGLMSVREIRSLADYAIIGGFGIG